MFSAEESPKPCEGGAPKLAPIRFPLMARSSTDCSLVSQVSDGAASAATAPPKYMPPSQRKEEEAKPKVLSGNDFSSDSLFPSLGSATPKTPAVATPIAPKGSWGNLRARFSAASTPVAAPATPIAASENQFSALDDSASSVATPVTPTAAQFFSSLLQKDEEDAAAALVAAAAKAADPLTMTNEELLETGWTILPLAKAKRILAATAAEAPASLPVTPEEAEMAYLQNGDTWDGMNKIRLAMESYTTPYNFFREVVGERAAAEDLELHLIETPVAKPIIAKKMNQGFQDLLNRKKAALAAAASLASVACME